MLGLVRGELKDLWNYGTEEALPPPSSGEPSGEAWSVRLVTVSKWDEQNLLWSPQLKEVDSIWYEEYGKNSVGLYISKAIHLGIFSCVYHLLLYLLALRLLLDMLFVMLWNVSSFLFYFYYWYYGWKELLILTFIWIVNYLYRINGARIVAYTVLWTESWVQ